MNKGMCYGEQDGESGKNCLRWWEWLLSMGEVRQIPRGIWDILLDQCSPQEQHW